MIKNKRGKFNLIKYNGFFKVVVFDIISKVFSVFITLLLIRKLSTEEYATFTLFNSIALFIYGVVGSGISLAFVRFFVEQKTRESNKNNGLYFISIVFLIIIYCLILLIIPLTIPLLNVNVMVMSMALLYSLTLSLNQLNQSYYQARELYAKSGIVSNIKSVILLLSLLLLFYIFNVNVFSNILSAFILSTTIGFFVGAIYIFKNGERFVWSNLVNFKAMVKDSSWLMLYVFILNMFNQVDVFMIDYFLDDYAVANYGVAFKYYGLALTLLSAIQIIMRVKTASKEIIDDVQRQRSFTVNWISRIAPVSFAVTLLGVAFSWLFFPYINGSHYNPSIITFNILMIGVGLSYITAPNMGVMMASGRHKLLSLIAFGAFCINTLGNYFFIPIYGINAAAITTVLAQFFLNGICTLTILTRKS